MNILLIKTKNFLKDQKGLALLFVVLSFMAVGFIAFGAATLSLKLQKIENQRSTVKRMNTIQEALENYYVGHRELPLEISAGPYNNLVPVQDLNLEQKYRMDANGRYFYYDVNINTDINDVTVDTNKVAGVLISGGPNQVVDSNTNSPTFPDLEGWEDDIALPINLQSQAIEIATETVHILAKKACAYSCSAAEDSWPITLTNNISLFYNNFSLGDAYKTDPWGQSYQWYSPTVIMYSAGPDAATSTTDDDISAPAQGLLPCCQ
ncbi:hypothetical protein GMMP15_660091 [Candidatus Magnetomoraceae bacterium gMMP-15]